MERRGRAQIFHQNGPKNVKKSERSVKMNKFAKKAAFFHQF